MSTSAMQEANTMVCEKHGIEKERSELPPFSAGGEPFVFYNCKLCDEEREAEEKRQAREAEERMRHKKTWAGIPKRFVGASLSDFNNIDPIMEWVNDPKGFLFIHGTCGTGKTHLAAAIKRYFNEGSSKSRLVFSSELFLKIRNSFSSDKETELSIIEELSPDPDKKNGPVPPQMRPLNHTPSSHKPEIVLFDDIGAQKISDYVIEAWYNIIDRRYMFEHPTLFTSNLSLKEISAAMTDRIASRLASGIVFKFSGEDRRLKKNL